MNDLFKSHDSRFALKTSFLMTLVPFLMFALFVYSIWILISLNFSYFIANGLPLDEQNRDIFIDYLLKSQAENLPFIGLFFVLVFFIGLFLSYVILRPFNELSEMCYELLSAKDERIRIVGLERKKLLIKIGNFLCRYFDAKRNGRSIGVPDELRVIAKPTLDLIFYFQFVCMILILMTISVTSVVYFSDQLYDSIIDTGMHVLKSPKGLNTFLGSQKYVYEVMTIVPNLVGAFLYFFIARVIIRRVEGTTYAYLRDILDVASGNATKRLSTRFQDPGRQAAIAVNEVLELLHPTTQIHELAVDNQEALNPSKV